MFKTCSYEFRNNAYLLNWQNTTREPITIITVSGGNLYKHHGFPKVLCDTAWFSVVKHFGEVLGEGWMDH